jgi:hypothetical protein
MLTTTTILRMDYPENRVDLPLTSQNGIAGLYN